MELDGPNDWSPRRLGDLVSEVDRRLGDRTPLNVMSVTKSGVIPQSDTYDKSVSSADLSKYKVLRPGEYALAPMALYYGAIGRFSGDSEALISPAYVSFAHNETIVPEYLTHLIRLPRMVAQYSALSQGGNLEGKRRTTSFRDFCSIQRKIPGTDEQRAIAAILDSANANVSSSQRLVSSLERAKRDAMRRLLTLGMKGDAAELTPLKENWVLGRIAEGVEAIPKDWRLVQLTKYAKLESGHTPSRNHPEYWEGDIPWVSLSDTDRFDAPRLLDTTETLGDLGLKHSSARLLPEGTVVFSRTATVGKAAILGRPMATSQDFADWVCGSKLSPRYLLQVFLHMSREWKRLQAGSTHQTIYMPTFKKLQILLPPFDEQEAIADVGEAFDQRIAAERVALDELRASKGALAQELLSGRVRLPEATIRRLASTDHAEAS